MRFGRRMAIATMIAAMGVWLAFSAAVWAAEPFGPSQVEVIAGDGGRRVAFAVEVAVTPEQLAQGLMFRRHLAPQAGMLFDFGAPREVAMWMKNTLIPLDMLFIAADGTIVHVEEHAVPGSLEPRGPSRPVRGVLEVAAGTARRLGIAPGDRVVHPMFASSPVRSR